MHVQEIDVNGNCNMLSCSAEPPGNELAMVDIVPSHNGIYETPLSAIATCEYFHFTSHPDPLNCVAIPWSLVS